MGRIWIQNNATGEGCCAALCGLGSVEWVGGQGLYYLRERKWHKSSWLPFLSPVNASWWAETAVPAGSADLESCLGFSFIHNHSAFLNTRENLSEQDGKCSLVKRNILPVSLSMHQSQWNVSGRSMVKATVYSLWVLLGMCMLSADFNLIPVKERRGSRTTIPGGLSSTFLYVLQVRTCPSSFITKDGLSLPFCLACT